jgi:hypothetical protein
VGLVTMASSTCVSFDPRQGREIFICYALRLRPDCPWGPPSLRRITGSLLDETVFVFDPVALLVCQNRVLVSDELGFGRKRS